MIQYNNKKGLKKKHLNLACFLTDSLLSWRDVWWLLTPFFTAVLSFIWAVKYKGQMSGGLVMVTYTTYFYEPTYLLGSIYLTDENSNDDFAKELRSYLVSRCYCSEWRNVKSLSTLFIYAVSKLHTLYTVYILSTSLKYIVYICSCDFQKRLLT